MHPVKSNTHWATKKTSNFMATGQSSRREFPWDTLEPPPKKVKSNDKGAYHVLSTKTSSTSTASTSRAMTSSSLNIRQKVALSSEQQRVLQMVVEEGKNVFFTGSAGSPAIPPNHPAHINL
jgi:hypothetical protein